MDTGRDLRTEFRSQKPPVRYWSVFRLCGTELLGPVRKIPPVRTAEFRAKIFNHGPKISDRNHGPEQPTSDHGPVQIISDLKLRPSYQFGPVQLLSPVRSPISETNRILCLISAKS